MGIYDQYPPAQPCTGTELLLINQGGKDLTANVNQVCAPAFGKFNLRNFGWVGNGVTDDTPAFNAAHSALPASGGEIIIPFSPTGTVLGNIVTTKPVSIIGEGSGPNAQTTVLPVSRTCIVFDIAGAFSSIYNLAISTTTPASVKQTAGSYINIRASAARCRLEQLTLTEFFEGITLAGTTPTVEIDDIRAFLYSTGRAQSTAAIRIHGGLDVRITRVSAQGPGTGTTDILAGIWIDNLGDATIDDCDIISCGADLLVTPGNGQSVTSLWAINSFFDTAVRGIDFSPTGTGVIQRARISNCWASSHSSDGMRFQAGVNGVNVDSPHVFLNAGNGIYLNLCLNVNILGAQIAQNAGFGVDVAPNTTDFSITESVIGAISGLSGNTGNPVAIGAGSGDRFIIANNRMIGNTSNQVADASTGTYKSIYNNIGSTNDYRFYRDTATGELFFIADQVSPFAGYVFKIGETTTITTINNAGITSTGTVTAAGGTFTNLTYLGQVVSKGAADSGGTGYAVLRVPN